MNKLELSWPVMPVFIGQTFGVNGAYYQQHGINIAGHNGLDLKASHGQPVFAAHDGIAYYEVDGDQGEGVVVHTNDKFDFQGQSMYFKTIYWHLCDPHLEPKFASPVIGNPMGLKVSRGQLIGYADTTGFSTGDHLHFGLKPQYGESDGLWYNTVPDNGYMGAIDPLPYLGIVTPFTQYLSYGSIGSEVLALQRKLVQWGLGLFTPTGFFGPKTAAAVIAFQTVHNIPQTGTVGPITRSTLNAIVAGIA